MAKKRLGARLAALLALGGSLTLAPSRLFAWGFVGHKAIGIIAQERLSPQALSAVQAILGQNSQGHDVALEDIAACPDEIKYAKQSPFVCAGVIEIGAGEQTAFGPIDIPWKASSAWHFANVPNSASPDASDIEQYCPDNTNGNPAKKCVMAQIKYDMQILESQRSSSSDRQLALMFLVHFVGDEHQPLHINDDNDWGGNKKKVVFEGQPLNLHALWDDVLTPRYGAMTETAQAQAADAADLAAKLDGDLGSRDVSGWTSASDLPDQSAVESFYIAKSVIRPVYAQDYDPSQNAAVFGPDYMTQMQPIAYEQLEKAGVRLAYILNQIFSQAQGAAAQAAPAPQEASFEKALDSVLNFSFLKGAAWDGGN
ncbi:MAG TPA: S1/P1 nuclease [Elusimicrobiota bacterium]|nr:S1/P1 nuclease [Elusimicrobiota bacterium]